MKLHACFSILLILLVTNASGQTHYSPVGNFTDAMNINLLEVKVNGINLEKGDEIGIFDDDLCVGNAVLDNSLDSVFDIKTKSVVAGSDDPETADKDGFKGGDTIKYKYWDSSEEVEIEFTEVNYYNPSNGNEISPPKFKIGATVYVSLKATYNYKPKSNAGPDQILYEGESGQLDGSGSFDLNQDPLTYFWYDLDTLGLNEPDVKNPAFTAPRVVDDKEYRLVLVVNDGTYFSDPDTTIVTVLNVTSGPVPNAGADTIQTYERDTVFLDGSKSFDPDGLQIRYNWELSESGIELINKDSAYAYFIAPEVNAESLIYAVLTVTNSSNIFQKDTVFIKIENENIAPVAVAVYNTEVNEGEQVVINGSNSFDPDEGPSNLTYHWKSLNGGNISSTTNEEIIFTAPWLLSDSTFYFSLIVFDGDKYSIPDTVVIKVKHENLKPIANAGNNITVSEGDEVVLNGKLSFDPEGKTLLYEWISDYLILDDTNASDPLFIVHEVQKDTTVMVRLKVSDKELWSDPDTIWITIQNINKAPVWGSLPTDTAYMGRSYRGNINVYDYDIYDSIRITITDLPTWLSFVDYGNGTAELYADSVPHFDNLSDDLNITLQASDGMTTIDTTFTLHIDIVTGINEPKLNNLTVFPNPVHDWLTIQYNDEIQSSIILKMFNTSGILVHEEILKQQITKINLSELTRGNLFDGVY